MRVLPLTSILSHKGRGGHFLLRRWRSTEAGKLAKTLGRNQGHPFLPNQKLHCRSAGQGNG